MADLFKVEKGVVLTREQNRILKTWRKAWPCATDEERQEMLEKFAEMVRGSNVEEFWKSQGSAIEASTSEEAAVVAAAVRAAEEETQEEEEDPLKGRPHALYLSGGELMVIVEINKDVWADYGTFLTNNPDKTVFDIHPSKVAVAYMDQKAYNALVAVGKALDQNEVNKCIQPLPVEFTPFEMSFLEALLCMEADYDQRIKDLGYEGKDMKEYKESGLFRDYFTGKIFEIFHGKKEQTQKEDSKKGKGGGQKSNQSSGNGQKKGTGKDTGDGSSKVKRTGSGQPQQVKPGSKPGSKTNGSKGNIRSGKHNQTAAALFL